MISSTLDPQFIEYLDTLKRTESPAFKLLNRVEDQKPEDCEYLFSMVHFPDLKEVFKLTTGAVTKELILLKLNRSFCAIRDKSSLKEAQQWLFNEYTGISHLHDELSSSLLPFYHDCSLEKFSINGLGYASSYFSYFSANDLTEFVDSVKEFVSWNYHNVSGILCLSDLIIYLYYFYKRDIERSAQSDKSIFDESNLTYFRQNCQRLMSDIGLLTDQNPQFLTFVSISIFDSKWAHKLFEGKTFPCESLISDSIEEIIKLQKIFVDSITSLRRAGNVFTFPVLSYHLSTELINKEKKVFADKDFAKWCSCINYQGIDTVVLRDFSSIEMPSCSMINTINLANLTYDTIESYNTEFLKYEDLADKVKRTEDGSPESVDAVVEYVEEYAIRQVKEQVNFCAEVLSLLEDSGESKLSVGLCGLFEMILSIHKFICTLKNTCEIKDVEYTEFDEVYGLLKVDCFENLFYTERAKSFIERLFNEIHFELENSKVEINCEQVPIDSAIFSVKNVLQFPKLAVKNPLGCSNQFYPAEIKTTEDEKLQIAKIFDKALNNRNILQVDNLKVFKDDHEFQEFLLHCINKGPSYQLLTGKLPVYKRKTFLEMLKI